LKLEDYRAIFVAAGLVSVLLFASPSLGLVLRLPSGEKFSELWVLGPEHMAEGYPYNVKAGITYLVYLGVGNHMGSSVYYGAYVKFRNQSEALPNAASGTPSPVSALFEYRVFLEEGKSWEVPLTFSFSNVSHAENQSMVGSLVINDFAVAVDKSALWDAENKAYYYQLFVELWIYNASSSVFQFHNRFVGIWLNMTVASY
jgi:hypothetical protein